MALRTPLTAQPHLYIGDSTGRPLDYGRVYFGEPNKDPEFYPIDIYLDPEMTIAAAQPVRTKGGFMDVGGNLAELHAAEVIYSLKVLDQYGRQVFYKPEMYRNNVSDFLVDEITRATAAETLIAGNLTAETQRAVAAEKVIADAVVTEKDRAVAAEVALDAKHAALSSTINSLGGGKKAYTTYALMVADKNNIAANSSIDVTNDTDPLKNGTYSYDGAVFAKSIYDVETIVRTKVLNTFKTKSLMDASALPDGADAQVTDDTVNNGLYVKTAGAWVKSEYDPLAQAKTYTDNSLGYNTPNLDDILVVQDSNGQVVAKLDTFGRLRVMGLDTDVATAIENTKEINNNVFFDGSGGIIKILDSAGNTTLEQTKDGDLKIAGLGSLKESLAQIGRVDNTRANYSNQTNSLGVYQAAKYEDLRLVEGVASFEQNTLLIDAATINNAGLLDFTAASVRTMGTLRIGVYKYLIFFEAREAPTDLSRISSGSVVVNIDPITFASTLDSYNVLANAYPDVSKPSLMRTFMNGCGVKTDSGKIIYFCVRRLTDLSEHHLMMSISNDDGVSWTELVDISDMYKPQTGWNMLAPCTGGIVKRYGLNKGRLIMPSWATGKQYSGTGGGTGYIYSDDDGLTWHLGDFIALEKASEVHVAEDVNGDLLFNVRTEEKLKAKISVRLEDGTSNYIRLLNDYRFTDEPIMSSVIQGANIYDDALPKFIVSACETTSRRGMLLSTSYDGGYNWNVYNVATLSGKHVAYTHIEGISATHYVVFYESDYAASISSLVVSLDNLIEGVK